MHPYKSTELSSSMSSMAMKDPTAEAGKITTGGGVGGSTMISDRPPIVKDLYSPEDETCLSGLVCLLRAQLEVFAATSSDVTDRSSKKKPQAATSGKGPLNSPVPITVGRVGIRCKHCAHLSRPSKAKGAVSYPNSIRIMNQAVRNWQRYHFGICNEIPQEARDRYDELKAGKRVHSSKASQEYWPSSCRKLGLVDGPNGGIFFADDTEALRLYDEAVAAQKAGRVVAAASASGLPRASAASGGRSKRKKKSTKKTPKNATASATAVASSTAFPAMPGFGAFSSNHPFEKAIDDADVDLNFELDVNDLDIDLESWMQEGVDGGNQGEQSGTPSRRSSRTRALAPLGQPSLPATLDTINPFAQEAAFAPSVAQQHQEHQLVAVPLQQPLHLTNNSSLATTANRIGGSFNTLNIDASSAAHVASMTTPISDGLHQVMGTNITGTEGQLAVVQGPSMVTHLANQAANDRLMQRVRLAYDAIRATREMRFVSSVGTTGEQGAVGEDESQALFDLGKELYELFSDQSPFQRDSETNTSADSSQVGGSSASADNGPSKKRREQSSRQSGSRDYVPLLDLGFPNSVSNLVSNLLDTQTKSSNANDTNRLYRSVQEVEEDLYRMMTDPDRFLHDPDLATISGQLDIGFGTRLYGQDANIQKLLLAFDRVVMRSRAMASTSCEMLLVAGYSGTGKSSIIRHCQGPMMEKGGCFVSGKFDETRKNQPLSAIVDALEQFCDLLLMESPESVEAAKNTIKEAIGDDARVLTGLIPGLTKIIGEPQGEPSFTLGSKEAYQRLIFLFGRLLSAIARPSRPLIFFLDDLQWADEFSLELIRSFVCDAFITPMLILGCYRENEVVDGHPLKVMLGKLVIMGASVGTLRIGNMDEGNINMMLSDALHMSPRLTESLANIVYHKTEGNGLFAVQFLKLLCDEGLLTFSLLSRKWEWDVDAIKSRDMAEDVVGLLATKMLKLDASALWGLKIASCLGSQCDESTIKFLGTENEGCSNGMSPLLDVSVNEGLMFKVGTTYCFAHDEIQNAAYSLITESERKSVHLQIGKALCTRVPHDQLDSVLFIAVDQLFRGADVITSRDEIVHLTHLALRAGDSAIAASAFLPASLYLLQAIGLLEESDWTNHYDMTLQLYSSAAEACYVLGNFDTLNDLSKEVLMKASNLQDKLRVYFSLTSSLSSQGKMLDAINFGLGVLDQLGERFPANLDDDEVIADYMMKTSSMLRDVDIQNILTKPMMQDEAKKSTMQFLGIMVMHSYLGRPRLCPVVASRMVQLSLSHGVSEESAFAFAVFGAVLSRSPEGVTQGYRLGKIAMSLMKKFDAKGYLARVYAATYGLINCFVEPLQACEESVKYAYEVGVSTGDIDFAYVNAALIASIGIQSGGELEPFANLLSSITGKMTEGNSKTLRDIVQVYLIFARNLMGETKDPVEMHLGSHDLLNDILETQNKNALGHYYFARMNLSYIFGRYDLAAEMAEECRKATTLLRNARLISEIFYMALLALASADDENRAQARGVAADALTKLEGWLATSRWNFLHKVQFLKAEIAFHDGNIDDAANLYDDTIRIAGEHRFIHEQALACERCGIFYSSSGNSLIATDYFTRAHEYYTRWGAKRKALALLERINDG